MSSSASHVISTEALIRLRYYYVVVTLGKEVFFRIFNYCFLHGSSKSLLEILQDNCVPLGKKSIFNKDEIRKISTLPPEMLDITAIHKICETLWEKNVNNPGADVRKLLKKIKDERNNMSHNEHRLSESELKTRLTEFNQILQDVLDAAKNLYSVHSSDIDGLKVKIQVATSQVAEKIREKYDASNQEDIKKLKQEIEEFGDKLSEYIEEKTYRELSATYEVLCRILPFEWLVQYAPTFPCSFSVSLKMDTDKNFHFGLSTNTVVTLSQDELLQSKDPNGNDPKVIIISGDAGSGKSTLLSSIVENWYKGMHSMPCLSSFQILLYMQFREHNHDNFNDYLRELLQHTILDFQFELVKSFILKSRCLILCDGYDEANASSMKLFEEILKLKIANMKIVVTTRPVNTKELTDMTNKARHYRLNVTLLGLRKEDMESHIETLTGYLKMNEDERKKILKKLTQVLKTLRPEMREILRIPLWFNIFILLQIECPDDVGDVNSVTGLYLQTKKHNKKRLTEKLGITDEKIASFDQEYKEWCLRYYIQDKYELSQNDARVFQTKCIELDLDFDLIMSSYFSIKHTCKSLDIVKVYCYRHRREQEFNAASIICEEILKIYKNKPEKFEMMRTRNRRLVYDVLWSVINKAKLDVSLQQSIQVTSKLNEIYPFISGILYAIDRSLYYLLFDHIAPIGCNPIDPLFRHLNETNNDACIRRKIMENLRSRSELHVENSLTFLYLPAILGEVLPSNLRLIFDENFDDPNILLPVIEVVNKHKIETFIDSRFNKNVPAESYISKIYSCTGFYGRLTVNGIRALPTNIKHLTIYMDLEELEELSSRLQVLNLNYLCLELIDHGTIDPNSISLIENTGDLSFSLFIRCEYDVNNSASLERLAKIVNAVWPLVAGEECEKRLTMYSSASGFSGDAVKCILERLDIKSLDVSFFVIPEARESKEELSELCHSKGMGKLNFNPA